MAGNPRKGIRRAATCLVAGTWLANTATAAEPRSIWLQDVAAAPQPADRPVVPPSAPPSPAPVAPPAAAAPVVPAEPAPASQPSEPCAPPKSVWDKVPPVHPVPRLGSFLVPPGGCGYYSALDAIFDNKLPGPPNYPYPPTGFMAGSFFDADYRYLDKPDNKQTDFFDCLKRQHLGCDWMFTTGGEVRYRYMDETNSRFSGTNNQYDLFRTRVYGDVWYRDLVRVYAEFIYANSWNQDLAPLPIDVNQGDALNLFVDVKVADVGGHPVYVRAGRQELLYGSERLISPLDWANTRRTFQGVKSFYQGDKFDVDAFWVQPVAVSPGHFDSVDDALNFTGIWTTYRPQKGHAIDVYALNLDRSGPTPPGQDQVPGAANVNAPNHFNITTLGSRYVGDRCGRLTWDTEGMVQIGDYGNKDLFAYAYTTGLGYRFADLPMTPHLWAYFDYASGDAEADRGGSYNTFNQLFPLGHYYFGYLDQVGRQNIQDLHFDLNYFPARWITGIVQYHRFWLAEPEDALYNAGGKAVRQDPTGRAGRDVGQEIDFLWNFHMTSHQDVLVGYSKLFAGEFIKRTGNPDSPELFYLQYSYRW
jgi:hypothetical protein